MIELRARTLAVLVVLVCCSACASSATPVPTPEPSVARSQRVITLLSRRDYAQLEGMFTPPMRAAVPASKLEAAWSGALRDLGAYRSSDPTRTLGSGDASVELTSLRFERGIALLTLHWTKPAPAGQIQGLLLQPGAIALQAVELAEATLRGESAAVYGKFSALMMEKLPASRWTALVEALREQVGPAARVEDVEVRFGAIDVALVQCRGKAGAFAIQLAFKHDTAALEGLHFVPPKSDIQPDAALPAYANPALYTESAVEIGPPSRALPATFTRPRVDAPVPAVVLVHGSGPHDRDETILANRPFRDLAAGLASRGIAVLRYEKRTFGANAATLRAAESITFDEETVDDAVSAAQWLLRTTSVDPERVIVVGHSQGGMAAPRIAQREPRIRALVLLATPARPLDVLLLEQTRYLAGLDHGDSAQVQAALKDMETKIARVQSSELAQTAAHDLPLGVPATWWLSLRDYSPVEAAKSLAKPILVLQGDRDFQVTATDFSLWKSAIGAEPWAHLRLLPGQNHLFEVGQGPSTPAEYARPGHVSADAVSNIADWILALPPTAAP
jgi:dienelactone hydrolase